MFRVFYNKFGIYLCLLCRLLLVQCCGSLSLFVLVKKKEKLIIIVCNVYTYYAKLFVCQRCSTYCKLASPVRNIQIASFSTIMTGECPGENIRVSNVSAAFGCQLSVHRLVVECPSTDWLSNVRPPTGCPMSVHRLVVQCPSTDWLPNVRAPSGCPMSVHRLVAQRPSTVWLPNVRPPTGCPMSVHRLVAPVLPLHTNPKGNANGTKNS